MSVAPFLLLVLTLTLDLPSTSAAFVPSRRSGSGAAVKGIVRIGPAIRDDVRGPTPTELNAAGSSAGVMGAALRAGAAVSGRNLAVAGRIPWQKLLITKAQALRVVSIMRSETHVLDLMVVFALSVFPERIGEFLYNKIFYRFRDGVAYEDSWTYQITDTVSEASQLAVLCYAIDTIEVALEVVGIKGHKVDVSTLIAKLIYATWACFRGRMYKRSFFETVAENAPKKLKGKKGAVEIFDKVSDFFIFAILGLVWTDILHIKRGSWLSSIFALGGAGTFTLTLASQDLAKRALNGLTLAASGAFRIGDQILLGDGTSGHIMSMGWLDTEIRGSDELITRIPNSQLSNIRISNRSRMKLSQVKQTLRFRYQDLEKIPELVDDIKREIKASCPKAVTDGSRPFRVKWTDYREDHIEVLVDIRLRNPPTGDKYYEARQGVLEAIARAMRRNEVVFAVPMFEEIAPGERGHS